MKIFPEGNFGDTSEEKCLICKTGKKGPVVLVDIDGTNEAYQIHLSCLNLSYNERLKMIHQEIE